MAHEGTAYASHASIPLIVEGHTLGALGLSFDQPRAFEPDDCDFILVLARQCAHALDRARWYEVERSARQKAEAALKLRDQFIMMASHELKTPLTVIMGYAALLQRRTADRTGLDEFERRAVRSLFDQTMRLNRLITALLDVSRIENGELHLEHTPVDLAALARRVLQDLQPLLGYHTLDFSDPGAPLLVEGDELRLEQVLQNLLLNAIKYSPKGGPMRVLVRQDGEQARLSVTDEGIGIPAAALPNLFARYYRADNAKVWRIEGIGLGLYLVKEIVRLHGGSIEVESREDKGSTFTIALPLARKTPPESAPK